MVKLHMKKSHDNISPLDSRYASKIEDTRSIFSEANLIKVRFDIEIVGKLLGNFLHKNKSQSISKLNLTFIKLASEKIDRVYSIFDA